MISMIKNKSGEIPMEQNFENELYTIIDKDKVKKNEPMKEHTTFRAGGPADYFAVPTEEEEIRGIIRLCKREHVPYYVIGNGSNLLVGDKGYRGVIIQVYRQMNLINIEGNILTAQAGASLAMTASEALNAGLAGFEFAAGIPGTLGGAVVMNAGAYGGEIKDVLLSARVLTKEGEILTLTKEELKFGYRRSIIAEKEYIVLGASIGLEPGNKEEIRARMNELRNRRVGKQPLEYPSAGSTFKRPEGSFAGKLIQDAGLKGFTVGGAQVSEKHSGFVINTGDATAADIRELIRQVREKVKADSGIELEPEVKQIGEF